MLLRTGLKRYNCLNLFDFLEGVQEPTVVPLVETDRWLGVPEPTAWPVGAGNAPFITGLEGEPQQDPPRCSQRHGFTGLVEPEQAVDV